MNHPPPQAASVRLLLVLLALGGVAPSTACFTDFSANPEGTDGATPDAFVGAMDGSGGGSDRGPPVDGAPPPIDAEPPPNDAAPPPIDAAPPPIDAEPPPIDAADLDAVPVDGAPPDAELDAAIDAELDAAIDAELDACVPADEICNGIDDDCSGEIDDAPLVGEICSTGVGGCNRAGQLVCDQDEARVVCDAIAGAPEAEECNGVDDDCNGTVDDVVGLGGICAEGQGVCRNEGVQVCDPESGDVVCSAVPEQPIGETCNGFDNDCNGVVDDPPGLGDACEAGVGVCTRGGSRVCDLNLGALRCTAVAAEPGVEICDAVDNDCNGEIDDAAGAGDPCGVGVGECRAEGALACDAVAGELRCEAVAGAPGVETCNGLDDDCNDVTDDVEGLGAGCARGVGACLRPGAWVCDLEANELVCDAVEGEPGAEVCNGVDDDCEGLTDEDNVCGGFIAERCTVWLGYADNNNAPQAPSGAWGECMRVTRDNGFDVRCVASSSNARFMSVELKGDVNADDWLGVAFTCDHPGDAAMAAWIQAHCAVALGHVDVLDGGEIDRLDPRACPAAVGGDAQNPRCVSSSGDGLFHPMKLIGNVDGNDKLGIAFTCDDPENPSRAANVAASAEAFLGWQWRGRNLLNFCQDGTQHNVQTWGDCPGASLDNGGRSRCAGTHGDQSFHHFSTDEDVDECSVLSVALRAR